MLKEKGGKLDGILREMLVALRAQDSDRYWKAFEKFIVMHKEALQSEEKIGFASLSNPVFDGPQKSNDR